MTVAIVSGAIANRHRSGGAIWTRLSWALGLRRLGFDVHVVEQIHPSTCVDSTGRPTSFHASANLAVFSAVAAQFGLTDRATLVCGDGRAVWGRPLGELERVAADAELLLNISGHLTLPSIRERVHRRVYLDLDPGYTQLWDASGQLGDELRAHDFHFTVGASVGTSTCRLPTGGLTWRPIRQPVTLEEWPVCPPGRLERLTTVASWRGPYGPVAWDGLVLGPKAHQFRRFLELPVLIGQSLELALDIDPADEADLRRLRQHGWRVVDPRVVAADVDGFRSYVQGSGAEFSVAQAIYVETASGWFSDRTVRYLASGKPALVQDTGFTHHLPVGDGLLAFRTLEEAVEGVDRIAREYRRHCRAARALAEEYFRSDRVLRDMVDQIGVAP